MEKHHPFLLMSGFRKDIYYGSRIPDQNLYKRRDLKQPPYGYYTLKCAMFQTFISHLAQEFPFLPGLRLFRTVAILK